MSRHTSSTTAGPTSAPGVVTAFTFAVTLGKTAGTRAKRAAEVAEHIEGTPGAVVAGERQDGERSWLTVVVQPPVQMAEAKRLAEGCPRCVAGTFEL